MRYLTEAWIGAARLRRKAGKPSEAAWQEGRRRWLTEHAPGKSVADIGGLFIDGRLAFDAEEAGASAVTLFDAGDREYAPQYLDEHTRRGSKVRYIQGDVHDDEAIAQVGPHDVVWCTGVLYHTPSPVHQLMQLRKITRELLYLGTHTIAEVPGIPQACLYYPYLDSDTRAALRRAHYTAEGCLGVGPPIDERPMHGFANFWWGITPSALVAMLRTARFEVVHMPRIHASPFYVDVIARPIAKAPMLPPADYYRRRREARDRGEVLPWEDFYETSN